MDNLRGSLLMTLAMLGFALEDVFIKALAARLPPGQILALLGAGGSLVFVLWFVLRRTPVFPPGIAAPPVLLRTLCEAFGSAFFISSLALIPLTTASAVIQATPLVVAMGGALFLGQTVGWRRWLAITLGLCGVLMILRPGFDGFRPATLLAVIGMFALAARDLTTRRMTSSLSGAHLSMMAFASLIPTGLVVAAATGTPLVAPTLAETGRIAAAVIVGLCAYLAIVAATRIGDVAVISTFRYSRLLFALAFGFTIFGERPDAMTLGGAALIVAAGVYALLREARASQNLPPPVYDPATSVSAPNSRRTAP